MQQLLKQIIQHNVSTALEEDLAGQHDITALLIPEDEQAIATVITREACTICGQAWVNEVAYQIDPKLTISWEAEDGADIAANSVIFHVSGKVRSILTAERSMLNFLQLLTAVATITKKYVAELAGTNCKLLDTRKTIPGLRAAQKYAVRCGKGQNHRMGLYDAFLIKENHIAACGSIKDGIKTARNIAANKPVEIEVENLIQLEEAINNQADIIMLDNFTLKDIKQAVTINKHRSKLEVSGNILLKDLKNIAKTGVDYISVGAITKNIQATDLSMRLKTQGVKS